jgi:protein-disulfide isomerase
MNKEVEDYMNRNWKRYTSYKYDTEALKIRIRRGLLDLRKKNKLEEFRRALLKKHDVISSGPDVKEIKIDIEINEMDHKLGPDTAQNRIVIFMDMECPFCEKIFPNLMELKNDYGDTLQLVYKHFPLESHRNAINLALEANCAGEQGLFFEYVKTVHADEDYSRCQDCKEAFFTKFEVNRDMFANCVENEKNIEPIIDSMSSGKKLGVTSVPTIFVNGFPVFGNMSKERLNALIKGEDMFDDD